MTNSTRNAIVVCIDALRRDRVGCDSGTTGLTPNIDKLSRDGVVFNNAFSSTNATDPSVTSFHSGRDPLAVAIHHGSLLSDSEKNRLSSVSWLPEVLNQERFRTYATGRLLGRWHNRGFDNFPSVTFNRHSREQIGDVLERISPRLRSLAGNIHERVRSVRDSVESQDEVDKMLEYVDSADGPFYGYVHSMDTHVPYDPDPKLVEQLLKERNYPNQDLNEFFEANDGPYFSNFFRESLEPRDFDVGLARIFARYDATVIEADRKVGRLIEGLEERGLLDETALIVLSDHGESLGEHGIYFDHHGLYDETIRVPLVIHNPATSGSVSEEYVMLKDIPHTVLDLLGVDASLGGTGRSLAPLISGDEGSWTSRERVVVGEAHTQRRLAIRTPEWKCLTHVPDPVLEEARGSSVRCGYCEVEHDVEALFDLQNDPGETQNVLEDNPEIAAKLEEELLGYVESVETVTGGDSRAEFDDESEVTEQLKDLGYM